MNKFDQYINERPIHHSFFQKLIKNPKVIFDIGCCEGEDSIRLAKLFPEAMIYAFEPRPDNHETCLENFNRYQVGDRIKLSKFALSNKVGSAQFYLSEGTPAFSQDSDWNYGNKSSSLLPPNLENIKKNWEWMDFKNTIQVETSTLTKFCCDNQIKEIDIVYMDVQGAEFEVLEGCENFLKNISLIWLEYAKVEFYHGQKLGYDLIKYMKKNNFSLIFVTDNNCQDGDMLFVNRNIIKMLDRFKFKISNHFKL